MASSVTTMHRTLWSVNWSDEMNSVSQVRQRYHSKNSNQLNSTRQNITGFRSVM